TLFLLPPPGFCPEHRAQRWAKANCARLAPPTCRSSARACHVAKVQVRGCLESHHAALAKLLRQHGPRLSEQVPRKTRKACSAGEIDAQLRADSTIRLCSAIIVLCEGGPHGP